MARPRKLKKIYDLPLYCCFAPLENSAAENSSGASSVRMSVEEYEAIRLIDVEGLTQAECAAEMEIARTSVQGIYAEARRKLGDFLVSGKKLCIGGGEYRVDASGCHPNMHGCHGMHEALSGMGRGPGRGRGGQGRGPQCGRGRVTEPPRKDHESDTGC